MNIGSYEFQVLVGGKPLTEYSHQRDVFVEGRKGNEYTLRVRNTSERKVLAVVSVDGLSVMDGKPASEDGGGYVIHPYSYVDIPGWRLNNDDVAKFVFAELPESYASQMGTPENIGVIGTVIFREKRVEPVWRGADQYPDISFESLGGPQAKTTRGVGTGFGKRQEHRVQSVDFERESARAAKFVLRYDDADGLRARGIVLENDRVVNADPFPKGKTGATPPPGWKG